MKEELIEIGKTLGAFISGGAAGLAFYIREKRKQRAEIMAAEIANSEYWKKEVQDIMKHTDAKIETIERRMTECYSELKRYQDNDSTRSN
jgi:cysteine synthase